MRKKMSSWCTASERATKGESCADQMTDSFQAQKDDAAFLEPSACDAFRTCKETVLRCMCSVYGCTFYIMWNNCRGRFEAMRGVSLKKTVFPRRTENHQHTECRTTPLPGLLSHSLRGGSGRVQHQRGEVRVITIITTRNHTGKSLQSTTGDAIAS